jgi:hypothetical protein
MRFTARKIALIALMSAVCVIGRTLFQFLPNIQPVTAIVLFLAVNVGLVEALCVAEITMLVTGLYMGLGYWVIGQLLGYAVVIVLARLLLRHASFWQQVGYAFFAGLLSGFIQSLVQAPMFGITAFWPYYVSGVSFDVLHGIGNVGFYLLLIPLLKREMRRFGFSQS